ncbi:MAG TPA: M20/M25/M40 family metallo-hydrolase [Candidatus Limnocylindria bacterium]|nr:M20/M25/M40 family metallo-hydrolase [Candidatus Limnocylindria bacterium]
MSGIDRDLVLGVLERVGSAPTAPYHERYALDAIEAELRALGIDATRDRYGQVGARVARGGAARALVLVAHTDHPGFHVVAADGREGRVRVSGGFRERTLVRPIPVLVHDDEGGAPVRATIDGYVRDLDEAENSPGHARITASGPLREGQWAVPDLPGLEVRGDELHMRAADDLAGCALAVLTLAALREEARPHDVHALFTRAEETGLFGARLAAEDGGIPRDAYVVSIEASNAVYAPPGAGIVVRVGDLHNTFSNEAERYLRVAQERLAARGIPTQRRLLPGGTCEASAFVRLGWVATAVALPNTNYHNDGPGGIAPEVVRLTDLVSGIALLAEAAAAAGEDASESWWPSARRVPDGIRTRLTGPSGRSAGERATPKEGT